MLHLCLVWSLLVPSTSHFFGRALLSKLAMQGCLCPQVTFPPSPSCSYVTLMPLSPNSAPLFSPQDHGGVVINITATLSYRGQALQVHAGSAKAAIGT